MGIIQYIDVVRIPVKDLKRATHFYSVGLGLDFQFELDKCSYFSLGNTQIILDSKIENTSSFISFFLNHEKIIETVLKLSALGAITIQQPEIYSYFRDRDRWKAKLKDTEGNIFELTADIYNGQV